MHLSLKLRTLFQLLRQYATGPMIPSLTADSMSNPAFPTSFLMKLVIASPYLHNRCTAAELYEWESRRSCLIYLGLSIVCGPSPLPSTRKVV